MSEEIDAAEDTLCRDRGYHEWKEFIDPESGGFAQCIYCGVQIDCEDPDGDCG